MNGKETFFDSNPESPNVLLSMLEYSLFLFIRYPLAAPERSGSGVASTPVLSIPGVNVHCIQAYDRCSAIAPIHSSFESSFYGALNI